MMEFYIGLSIVLGIVYAEASGYFLHILFHSDKIKFLSRSHMRHHIVKYGPEMPQRLNIKGDGTIKRILDSGIGIEWIPPVVTVVGLVFLLGWIFNIALIYQLSFVGALVLWVGFLFVYMHDAIHVEGIWLEKNKLFGKWFLSVRRGHDIHHINVSRSGLLNKNYGICFLAFDKLFGTFSNDLGVADTEGLENLHKRFPELTAEIGAGDTV